MIVDERCEKSGQAKEIIRLVQLGASEGEFCLEDKTLPLDVGEGGGALDELKLVANHALRFCHGVVEQVVDFERRVRNQF